MSLPWPRLCLLLLVATLTIATAHIRGIAYTTSRTIRYTSRCGPYMMGGDRRLRKAAERAANEAKIAAKLAADASFFWELVAKQQAGIDITGCSGAKPQERSAETLFKGTTAPAMGLQEYDGIPVSRSGVGASEAEVPPLGDGFSLQSSAGLQLPAFALRNLVGKDRMRIESPTPIQRHCVPLALASFDLMACAQTGSGKTVAFLLPLLARVAAGQRSKEPPPEVLPPRKSARGRLSAADEALVRKQGTPAQPSALVLAPTRELALQIELECAKLTFEAPPPPSGAKHWCVCCVRRAGSAPTRLNPHALESRIVFLLSFARFG